MSYTFIPVTIYFEGKEYQGGTTQEIPDELDALIDRYNQKREDQLEKLQESKYVIATADPVSAADPNFTIAQEEIIQEASKPDTVLTTPKRQRKSKQTVETPVVETPVETTEESQTPVESEPVQETNPEPEPQLEDEEAVLVQE